MRKVMMIVAGTIMLFLFLYSVVMALTTDELTKSQILPFSKGRISSEYKDHNLPVYGSNKEVIARIVYSLDGLNDYDLATYSQTFEIIGYGNQKRRVKNTIMVRLPNRIEGFVYERDCGIVVSADIEPNFSLKEDKEILELSHEESPIILTGLSGLNVNQKVAQS